MVPVHPHPKLKVGIDEQLDEIAVGQQDANVKNRERRRERKTGRER